MGTCNLPEKVVGPYNQTLYLGCSVSSFTCNLGWGADQSTVTVNLVEDKCKHPAHTIYNTRITTPINSLLNQAVPQGGESQALTDVYNVSKNGGDVNLTRDTEKNAQKNIAHNIQKLNNDRVTQNSKLPNVPSLPSQDLGKKCSRVFATTNPPQPDLYWTDADPGFLPLAPNIFDRTQGFDILGVPTVFRFNNFSFGGFISSWKQTGGTNAVQNFEVEIKSFSSMLNGCQLIIDNYAGTMCGIVPNTNANVTNQNLAMPMPYTVNYTAPPTFNFYDHRANIRQGKMPNVFNIYGYLEYLGYKGGVFGNAGINEDGMRAAFIYDALVGVLGNASNLNNAEVNRFFPYGSILTRSIRKNDGSYVDTSLFVVRDATTNAEIRLTDLGICPNHIAYDQILRSRLLLDLSEVPRPPLWLRIKGPILSIMDFITTICDGCGFDFFVDFIGPPPGSQFAGTIKIRTVSRRKQPRKNQIDEIITRAANRLGVISYSKGKEYSDTNVRSMYVGGNQKRLLQFKNNRYAQHQNTLIYDPYANGGVGSWIDYGMRSLTAPNQVRLPNLQSTRRYSVRAIPGVGAAVCSDSNNFNTPAFFSDASSSRQIVRGNYDPAVNLSDGQLFIELSPPPLPGAPTEPQPNPQNIALYKDTICPYFGTGYSGLIRKVFFDARMGQMEIAFEVMDVQKLTDLPLTIYDPYGVATTTGTSPLFLVLENEIRAAGAGFGSWMSYCFGNIFTTDISELVYKGFRAKYGFTLAQTDTARRDFLTNIRGIIAKAGNLNAWNVDKIDMDQVSVDDNNPTFKSLFNDLQKIHLFFAEIANKYYGKQYMIRAPQLAFYRDFAYALDNNNQRITIGVDELGRPIHAVEGTGKIYTNYSISSDGAWEEQGNWIDDTMVIGGLRSNFFADETGKIPSIIGFNASAESHQQQLFSRQQFLLQAAQRSISDSPRSQTALDWEFVLERMINDPILNGGHYYQSVNHQLSPDEHLMIPYNVGNLFQSTAHQISVPPTRKHKLYTKAEPSSETQNAIAFLEPNYSSPRAILGISSPVYMGQNKNLVDYKLDNAMTQDALLVLARGPKLPDLLKNSMPISFGTVFTNREQTIHGGFRAHPLANSMLINPARTLLNLNRQHNDNFGEGLDAQEVTILPKAAIPIFCALAVEFNTMPYGPWINHPGLIKNVIFPDSLNTNTQDADVENLIGGVKVYIDPNLTPWNFGNMANLDQAVMLKIADEVNYQQILEMGTVQFAGFDNYSLGDIIKFFGATFDGPVINSIQVQIGEGGLTTTYNFRTYKRVLGLFNKENADRIKAISQEALKRNKEISQKIFQLSSKIGMG